MYRVMIVDDDLATLYMLKRFKNWEQCGFFIGGEACDGKEALQKLAETRYELIITDIKMPGMDGIEFIQELRTQNLDTCVIFLSTHSDFQFAKQGIRYGVFEYMTKPLEEAALSDILTRAKVYIAAKKEQEERINNFEKVHEGDNKAYYPGEHEKLIISQIINSDTELKNTAKEAFAEICTLYDCDAPKVRVLANTLLFNIRTKIDEKFPWLAKIEGTTDFSHIKELTGIEAIGFEFMEGLGEIMEKVRKYQLNHPDSLIRKICQCVIDNIEKEINLEIIANEVHISKDYVGKLFKQKVACNFNDYVTKIKMEHAKYLIVAGDYRNYEISEKLGYKKTDYFSALFKNYTGLTPTEYKKCNFKISELQI